MDITRWLTPKSDGLYSLQPKMEKLYKVSKNKTGSWLWPRSWTPYCQIQTKIQESGKKKTQTTSPFRYDLNQITYYFTEKVRNIFKGPYLTGRVPDELWTEVHDIVQETGINIIPKKKKCKKAKGLSEEALQIAVKWREAIRKGEKERDTHLNAEFHRIARRDKKAFLKQCGDFLKNWK